MSWVELRAAKVPSSRAEWVDRHTGGSLKAGTWVGPTVVGAVVVLETIQRVERSQLGIQGCHRRERIEEVEVRDLNVVLEHNLEKAVGTAAGSGQGHNGRSGS